MTIPEDVVRKLNELPIEEVASVLGITVAKHKARCFMHDDHRPSLSFNVKKNLFFCFVCNKGGGPIQLVQEPAYGLPTASISGGRRITSRRDP